MEIPEGSGNIRANHGDMKEILGGRGWSASTLKEKSHFTFCSLQIRVDIVIVHSACSGAVC